MTNGEKIKEVFPSIGLYEKSHDAIQINFDSVWWNAEYKEPTTKNNLEVAKAIEILKADSITGYSVEDVLNARDMAIKALEQEPKTGHWIFVGEENEEETRNGNFRYICSKCGYSDVHAKSTEVPYCWHCGAKMVDPQESEDKE